jgi:hypothetical protein
MSKKSFVEGYSDIIKNMPLNLNEAVSDHVREQAAERESIPTAVEQEIVLWLRNEADPSCSGGQTLLAYADAIASGKYRARPAQEGQS